jgi:hypothetical protein
MWSLLILWSISGGSRVKIEILQWNVMFKYIIGNISGNMCVKLGTLTMINKKCTLNQRFMKRILRYRAYAQYDDNINRFMNSSLIITKKCLPMHREYLSLTK